MSDDRKSRKRRGRWSAFVDWVDSASFDSLLHYLKVHHAMRPYWIISLGGSLALTAAAILLDAFVPMTNAFGFLRALVAMVLGFLYFMLGYSIAIYESDALRRHYDDEAPLNAVTAPYVEYRMRFSFKQRRRQSYPFAALALVVVISSAYSHLYTAFAAVAIAMIVAIFAYARPTPAETVLMVNDRLDPRDIVDLAHDVEREEKGKSGGSRRGRKRRRNRTRRDSDSEDES